MSVFESQPLSGNQVAMLAQLLDGWAEISELTEEHSGLREFAKVAEMLLGADNWRAIQSRARKFGEMAAQEEAGDTSGTRVVDPGIRMMSLGDRKTSNRHLARLGLDPDPEVTQAPEIDLSPLFDRLGQLVTTGRISRQEAARWQNVSEPADLARLESFIDSREPLPEGTFTE